MRRLIAMSVVVLAALGCALARAAPSVPPQGPALPGAPVCGPSTAGPEPTNGSSFPPPAPSYFASDFPSLVDSRLGVPIGGFGGVARGAGLHHTPVIFVHGNQADAQNWLAVMLQFQRLAGYDMQELYALSYNGLGNLSAGAPAQPPTQPDRDYVAQNPQGVANGGHGAANDDEVPDLCRFIEAVQWYTGSPEVDLVAHSLGVTIARKTMLDYPWIARHVVAFVGVAGANHGTSVCRGLESRYYGCHEIAPGTSWLAQLNGPGGRLETYPPTRSMTIFDGAAGDPFFDPPLDQGSPALRGADNRTFPGAYHDDLRADPPEVDAYLPFLLRYGQATPGVRADDAAADAIDRGQPDGRTGEICGIPKLTGPVNGCPALPSSSAAPPASSGLPATGHAPSTAAPGSTRRALRLTVRPRAVPANRCVRFVLRAAAVAGGRLHGVRGALVTFAGSRGHTGPDGRVRMRRCLASARRYGLRATKAGFRPGTAYVTARRDAHRTPRYAG